MDLIITINTIISIITNIMIIMMIMAIIIMMTMMMMMVVVIMTWPVRKENEAALQWAEMIKHRFPSKELTERLGIDDMVLQNKLRWYEHLLQKGDDWVKWEVEGPRPRERPKRTWREAVEKDLSSILLLLSLSLLLLLLFVPSVLWRCWFGGRNGIRPLKTE